MPSRPPRRHAGRLFDAHRRGHAPRCTLSAAQPAEKKLMLILTDGQPADVDVQDDRLLIEDARKAVGELDQQRHLQLLHQPRPQCRRLRERHLRQEVFGDRPHRALPERLPELFMALTR
jgi:nitric oxide reductase NorD protein